MHYDFAQGATAACMLRSPFSGLPRLAPAIWSSLIRGTLSDSYVRTKLTSIEHFYRYNEDTYPHPSLDYLITQLNFPEIELRLKGFLASLQNQTAIDGSDRSSVWKTVIRFVIDVLSFLSPIVSSSQTMSKLKASVLHLERMYSFLNPPRRVRPRKVRSLPSMVIEELYELTTPGSKCNPFRGAKLQMRNHIIFLLLLHLGLRKGEIS